MLEDEEIRRDGDSEPDGEVSSVVKDVLASLRLLDVVLVDADDDDDVVDTLDWERGRGFLIGFGVGVDRVDRISIASSSSSSGESESSRMATGPLDSKSFDIHCEQRT